MQFFVMCKLTVYTYSSKVLFTDVCSYLLFLYIATLKVFFESLYLVYINTHLTRQHENINSIGPMLNHVIHKM